MRSGGGRFRQFQPLTSRKPPRAPGQPPRGVRYLETFDKADGDPIGPVLTWNPASPGSAPTILSNECASTGVGAAIRAEHDVTDGQNMYIQWDWTVANGNDQITAIGRCGIAPTLILDEGIYAFIFYVAGSNTFIEVYDWGTNALYGTTNIPGNLLVATWRMELDGDEARIYRDDVLMLTASTAASTASGSRAGFELDYAGLGPGYTIIDNFEFGDL